MGQQEGEDGARRVPENRGHERARQNLAELDRAVRQTLKNDDEHTEREDKPGRRDQEAVAEPQQTMRGAGRRALNPVTDVDIQAHEAGGNQNRGAKHQ